MLEPTYLPYFCGMKKETHMYTFRPIINWDDKNDNNNDTSNILNRTSDAKSNWILSIAYIGSSIVMLFC